METLEAINKRKSIRAYKDEQITKEELDKIIGVANKAPNAGPFQVSVIQNKEFLSEINDKLNEILNDIQINMFNMCRQRNINRTTIATTMEEFEKNINNNQGYVKTMWCGDVECENKIKELTGAHSRCIPFEQEHISDTCVVCGKKADTMVVWGRQY